jgi:hypothetical protein
MLLTFKGHVIFICGMKFPTRLFVGNLCPFMNSKLISV